MIVSNTLPMLGSNRMGGTRRFADSGTHAGHFTMERRRNRKAEQAELVADLADDASPVEADDAFLFGPDVVLVGRGQLEREVEAVTVRVTFDDEVEGWAEVACYCRRCRKGDPGGCIVAEAEAEALVIQALAYYDAEAQAFAFEPCPEADEATCATCGDAFDACWLCRCDWPVDDEGIAAAVDQATLDAAEVAYEAAGYGGAFDPTEVQWGFTVSDRPLGGVAGERARDARGRFVAA